MAKEIQRINREAAKNDPESQFDSPEELAKEVGLTRGEKIAALERWAYLVDRRLQSGDEGMPTYGTEPRDAELLRRIKLTMAELQAEH
jgi:hypothetical protein